MKSVDWNNELILKKAGEFREFVKEELGRQMEGMARICSNFHDYAERKRAMKEELEGLEKQFELRKKGFERSRAALVSKVSNYSVEGIDLLVEELKVWKGLMNEKAYGRFKTDTLPHYISVIKEKITALENERKARKGKVLNTGKNMKRILGVYEDIKETEEIARIIASALSSLAPSGCSEEKLEAFIEGTLKDMKASDLDFHPFEKLDPTGMEGAPVYDMNLVSEEGIRRLFYSVLKGRVMKFARLPMMELFKEIKEAI